MDQKGTAEGNWKSNNNNNNNNEEIACTLLEQRLIDSSQKDKVVKMLDQNATSTDVMVELCPLLRQASDLHCFKAASKVIDDQWDCNNNNNNNNDIDNNNNINVNKFRIELLSEDGATVLDDTYTRSQSTPEQPDKSFLADLRKWYSQHGIDGSYRFRSKSPGFVIGRRFSWNSTKTLVVQPFEINLKCPFFSLGPSPSHYKHQFVYFSREAAFHLFKRAVTKIDEDCNNDWNARHIVKTIEDAFCQLYGFPVDLKFMDSAEKKMIGKDDFLLLLSTDNASLLKRHNASLLKCHDNEKKLIENYSTNGFEQRLGIRLFSLTRDCLIDIHCSARNKEKKKNTTHPYGRLGRVKQQDALQADFIARANNEYLHNKKQPIHLGAIGIDEGMKGVDANCISTRQVHAIYSARQCFKADPNDIDSVCDMLGITNDFNMKKATRPFSLSIGQVASERQTKCFEQRAAKELKSYLENLSDDERRKLNDNGGLTGGTDWASVDADNIAGKLKTFLELFPLRAKHYRHAIYQEWKFVARTAVESLAGRFFQQIKNTAEDLKQQYEDPSSKVWFERRESDRYKGLPGKKSYRKGNRAFRKDAWKAMKDAKLKEPQPMKQDITKLYQVDICPGDWNGRAPERSNTQMPRKAFVRRVRLLVRNYAESQAAQETGMIMGWKPQNEYRSSVQDPHPLTLVKGLRVNRVNPPNKEHANGNDAFRHIDKHRPWKLLYSKESGVILQRDMSAAFAIALQNAYTRYATSVSSDEKILPGYQRQTSSNAANKKTTRKNKKRRKKQ